MRTANIFLTKEEAQYGCRKLLTLPGQATPLSLALKPGTRNNTQLLIHNAQFYGKGGIIINDPVRVIIHVQGGVSTVGRRKKNRHWVLKAFALFVLVSICIGIGSELFQSKSTGSVVSGPNAGGLSDIYSGTPSGGGQTVENNTNTGGNTGSINNSGAAGPSTQTGTDIPAVLLQNGWENSGLPEYCPKFEFFPDGKFRMWINLGYDYCSFDAAYEVYQYGDGSQVISCDISSLYLEDCLWTRVYLLKSTVGRWEYLGTPIGFTDISCSFAEADSNVISTPAISVQLPNVAAGSLWYTEGSYDDLIINWVESGKVSFNFGIYRMFGYEDQIGFCAPDGNVYCFLNGVNNTGSTKADGLVRLTFQGDSVSLEFISASSESGYLQNYVGQTYVFR